MIRMQTLALCLICALLLSSCATAPPTTDPGASSSAPAAAKPGSTSPAKYAQEENAIAGLTVGASTAEDAIAELGTPIGDDTNTFEEGDVRRTIRYEGLFLVCKQDTKGDFIVTQVTVEREGDMGAPRGIYVGMPVEDLEALFPRELSDRTSQAQAGEGQPAHIEYLYAKRIQANANGTEGAIPPSGLVVYEPGKGDTAGAYMFLAPVDRSLPTFAHREDRFLQLQATFAEGKVSSYTITIGPL